MGLKMENRFQDLSKPDSFMSSEIPSDFPRLALLGSVTGGQPKILLIEENGKFYAPGMNPSALQNRFELCEDLVNQLVPKLLVAKAGKLSHLKEVEILQNYRTRLTAKKWTSIEEAHWIIDRVAKSLGWSLIGDEFI